MKRIIQMTIATVFTIGTSAIYSFGLTTSDYVEATMAAQKELLPQLQSIAVGFEKDFGFKNRAEYTKAVLGIPYEEVYFNKNFVDKKFTTENALTASNILHFPVLVNGESRVFFSMQKIEGKFQYVGMGSAPKARELQKLELKQLDITSKGIKKFLVLYLQKKVDFAIFNEAAKSIGKSTFIPLESVTHYSKRFNKTHGKKMSLGDISRL